jgi:O-antigen/teichoic acid export membrane protein
MLSLVVNSLIGFFLIRFFRGHLGETKYGLWVLVGSLFRYRGLMGMGVNSAVNRYIPVYLAKNDESGIQRVISTSMVFFSVLALVVFLASLILSHRIGSWFTIEPDLVASGSVLILIVGTCAAVTMPLQLYSAVLSGLQRYDITSSVVMSFLLLRTLLLVLLLSNGYGLLAMGLVFGISEVLMRLVQLSFAKRLLPQFSICLRNIDLRLFREMLAYGMNTFLYAAGALIIYKASDLVIGIFIGTTEISQFAIAAAGILLLSELVYAFTKAIKPAVSDLDARDEHSRIREMSFLTQKYSLLLIIPAGWFLAFMGRDFLDVWVGEKFSDAAVISRMAVILAILSAGNCLRLAQHSNFLVLVGRGEHRVFGALTVFMAAMCVSASVVSVKVFDFGLVGIAWSNFLPMALISVFILPLYFNLKMKIAALDSIKRVWLPALLGTLPAVAIISLWKFLAPPHSWLQIICVVACAMVATLASSWFFSFSEIERKRFLRIVAPSLSRNH